MLESKTGAAIYCRVSTTEQAEQGYSLESQEKDCRRFSDSHDLIIKETFIERGESAKTQKRTQLQRLLKYASVNKKIIGAVIVWKIDRLTRNVSDFQQLHNYFTSLEIRLLSVTETNEDSPIGRFLRTLLSAQAQLDNEQKSERTKRNMLEAMQKGRWLWPAPTGYKYAKEPGQKSIIIPTQDSIYVTEAFALFQTGVYRQVDIVSHLQQKGFNVTETLLNKILRNPLYTGLLKNKWIAEPIEGVHKPIVPRDVFLKVQFILTGKNPFKLQRHRERSDFPLKGLLLCHKCSKKLTAGWSRGRRGVKYGYYHCPTKGCSVNLRNDHLEDLFPDYLRSIQPKSEYLDLFEAILHDTWKTRQEAQLKEKRRLESEIQGLGEKIKTLDGLLSKGLDLEDYKRNIDQIKNDIMAKRIALSDLKVDESDFSECVQYCKLFLANTAKLWEEGNLTQRQRFQNLIFPTGITFDGETIRTKETALIYAHFQAKTKAEYHLVALRGFEPRSDD